MTALTEPHQLSYFRIVIWEQMMDHCRSHDQKAQYLEDSSSAGRTLMLTATPTVAQDAMLKSTIGGRQMGGW